MPIQPESQIAVAIFRTLLYADIFNFPMTENEIHHFLIGTPATSGEVRATLRGSQWLAERIEQVDPYYTVRGRAALVGNRVTSEAASAALWPHALRYGLLLAHLPFVRMVALTGALSVRNAGGLQDDIDFLIITTPGRVWLARAMAVIIVRLARLRGVHLCPNYVLAETALAQDKQDLYLAHELAQMAPIAGHDLYAKMRRVNWWSDALLPNAMGPFYPEPDRQPRRWGRVLQRLGEVVLNTPLGNMLERWEHRRKQRKFEAEAHQAAHSSAQLDDQHVKGHFNDHGYSVMDQYRANLRAYALSDELEAFQPVAESAAD